MGVIESIEAQIERLDAQSFAALRDWFIEHMHERWDKRLEADSAAGRLDFLLDEAAEAEQRGETRPL